MTTQTYYAYLMADGRRWRHPQHAHGELTAWALAVDLADMLRGEQVPCDGMLRVWDDGFGGRSGIRETMSVGSPLIAGQLLPTYVTSGGR